MSLRNTAKLAAVLQPSKPTSCMATQCARFSTTEIEGSDKEHKPRVLITGSLGQLGQGMAKLLRSLYGRDNVFSTDIIKPPSRASRRQLEPYAYMDVLDHHSVESFVVNEHIDWVVHFSAVLSAVGEANLDAAISINVQGMQNVMDIARQHGVRLFIPSTIGAFGADSPKVPPDVTVQRPDTIYGVAKVYTERLGEYMARRGLDFRSLRFPGVLSTTKPGGGTTDYAVEMFYDALRTGVHRCPLSADTRLPMMFIDDCLRSVAEVMVADGRALTQRTYNVHAMHFTPDELATEIRKHLPQFEVEYEVCPVRQAIADSWPDALDDTLARRDWGWRHRYDMAKTVEHMLGQVRQQMDQQ